VRRGVAFVQLDVGRLHGQATPVGHRIAGVHHEVHQHLVELPGVGPDVTPACSGGHDQLDVLADQPLEHRSEPAENRVEVQDRGL